MFRRLSRVGILGINARNAHYTLRWNPRRLYPLVDDKLATKRMCERAGIPTPKLLAVAEAHFQLRAMLAALDPYESFVLKPARGAMGNGIVVVKGRRGDDFVRSGGRLLSRADLLYHAAGIISGLYALAGQRDTAMVEECLEVHPDLAAIAIDGVPDVRVIVYRGVPVMSMTRLPTRHSGGRANLHQGAIGAGIDLASGRTVHAVLRGASALRHPDSGRSVVGVTIPHFRAALEIAIRATDQTGLGYVGADVVVDSRRGPVILELNARPGLAIQVANGVGLRPRLDAVDAFWRSDPAAEPSVEERAGLGAEIAGGAATRRAA
jgi:alpha-L-glutamate ligase-like protein